MNATNRVWAAALAISLALAAPPVGRAALAEGSAGVSASRPIFEGRPTHWHEGLARYDFVMNAETLGVEPFKAPEKEGFGIGAPAPGQRRCVVVVPNTPAAGNPWSWRGCYWDHQPQAEVELLRRGFAVAYISADAELKPGKEWEAWYRFLTDHGLSKRPAFVGMSRGGEYAYTWAISHPDAVGCIYADNPGGNPAIIANLSALAQHDVPILHVCGSIDPLLGRYSNVIEAVYPQLGGRISVMIKEGFGHHPHSLRDATPIADWIERNVNAVERKAPAFVGEKFTRTSFYGLDSSYRDFPKEGTHITSRGAAFTGCYDRYVFEVKGVEGVVTAIVPAAPAPGGPWVYRADALGRDSVVDLALLAKGFHIITGPVPYNADGPNRAHWDAVYQRLVDAGLSPKPVLAGAGAAAGEAYAWAIAHPDRVSCVYGENPILRSWSQKGSLVDKLGPLAEAKVPVLHVVGSEDPGLAENTTAAQKRYSEAGGRMKVIVDPGKGHYPTAPQDAKVVVDFILATQKG